VDRSRAPHRGELARLPRDNAHLREQLTRADLVSGIQKKLSELLAGSPTSAPGANT